jgi:dUTP pyrophosphatase
VDVFDPSLAFRTGKGKSTQSINFAAILGCDILFAELASDVRHVGTLIEIGFALANDIPVHAWITPAFGPHVALMQSCYTYDNLRATVDACVGVPAKTHEGAYLMQRESEFEPSLPVVAYAGDAGFDLQTAEDVVVEPGSIADVRLAFRCAPPPGIWLRLEARSSTSRKWGLLVVPGVIDNGWRGPLFAGVYTVGDNRVSVPAGTKLVQAIPHAARLDDVEFELVDKLPPAERGENGFGSTGV